MSPKSVFLCICIPSLFFLKFDMERSNVYILIRNA